MTENRKTPKPLEPAEPIAVFEVSDGGTLRMANYAEAKTRAEFYEYVAGFWSGSLASPRCTTCISGPCLLGGLPCRRI